MGYAIKCYFTRETAMPVIAIWDKLAEDGLADFLKNSGSRPGVSLGVWDHATENDLKELIQNFAARVRHLPKIQTFGVATFHTNPAQVFLGVVASEELLSLHKEFHKVSSELSRTCSNYYQPGNWVPHSTLAIRCEPGAVVAIIEKCLEHETRLEFEIGSIGIVETGTARQIAEIDFQK